MLQHAELHHHTTHSIYDGFQTPEQAVIYAKKLGYPALAITDHGNLNGAIEHYMACKKYGIHPVIGCEAYFQPLFSEEKRDYHMTLLAKNLTGYQHLCQLVSYANQYQWAHRHGVVTFPLLKKYHEGLIVTTGCIGGAIPQFILKGNLNAARILMETFIALFGDDFYVEVMPFPVLEHEQEPDGEHVLEDDEASVFYQPKTPRNIQREVNLVLLQLAEEYSRKVIMTSDAHYVSQDDYESYLFMQQEIAKKKLIANYENLYLHSAEGMLSCWQEMMGTDGSAYLQASVDLALSTNVDLSFDEKAMIPRINWGIPSSQKLIEIAEGSLKGKGKWSEEYQARLKHELDVVLGLGFEDYFLLCWDIVEFAKRSKIAMGYGRGSVCNSLMGYALGLTQVDPIILGTDFERFLRPDKKILPDVDFDFDPVRRSEIISYLMQRFNGSAYPISNYTYYKAKILVNDMAKQYPDVTVDEREMVKRCLDIAQYDKTGLSYEQLLNHIDVGDALSEFDEAHPGFLERFTRLYGEVRNIGKHAAGIAVTPDDITKYVPIIRIGGKEDPKFQTGYNMQSLGNISVLKLDTLGLDKVSVVHEVEEMTGCQFDYAILSDRKVLRAFERCDLDGVFQFESPLARRVVSQVQPDCFDDIAVCNSLIRPGAYGNVAEYIKAKQGEGTNKKAPWYEYTKETRGTFIYDEQKMRIARYLGHMEWGKVDKLMKQAKKGGIEPELQELFVKGAVEQSGLSEKEARKLIELMSHYSFNKGHAVGYSLLAFYSLWQRIYYPLEYYMAILRHESDKDERAKLEGSAILKGQMILLPHVNGTADYSIYDGGEQRVIQSGLSTIPHVGGKAALAIVAEREENGPFSSEEEFLERMLPKKRWVNVRVIRSLQEANALEFDMGRYIALCSAYCAQRMGEALVLQRMYQNGGSRW